MTISAKSSPQMFGRTLNVPPVKGAVRKYCWSPATSLNTESSTDFCEIFKGELRPKLHPCFYVRFFFWLYGERASHKVLWRFCMEKERRTKFCGVLYRERASDKLLWRWSVGSLSAELTKPRKKHVWGSDFACALLSRFILLF